MAWNRAYSEHNSSLFTVYHTIPYSVSLMLLSWMVRCWWWLRSGLASTEERDSLCRSLMGSDSLASVFQQRNMVRPLLSHAHCKYTYMYTLSVQEFNRGNNNEYWFNYCNCKVAKTALYLYSGRFNRAYAFWHSV